MLDFFKCSHTSNDRRFDGRRSVKLYASIFFFLNNLKIKSNKLYLHSKR